MRRRVGHLDGRPGVLAVVFEAQLLERQAERMEEIEDREAVLERLGEAEEERPPLLDLRAAGLDLRVLLGGDRSAWRPRRSALSWRARGACGSARRPGPAACPRTCRWRRTSGWWGPRAPPRGRGWPVPSARPASRRLRSRDIGPAGTPSFPAISSAESFLRSLSFIRTSPCFTFSSSAVPSEARRVASTDARFSALGVRRARRDGTNDQRRRSVDSAFSASIGRRSGLISLIARRRWASASAALPAWRSISPA